MSSIEREAFTLSPVVETWEATVYQVTGTRTAYLVVPRPSANGFTDALDAGEIDATITDYLNTPDTGRTLDQHQLMLTLGLFDRLGDKQALAAPERDPITGARGAARDRDDKNQDQQQTQNSSTTSTITTPTRTIKWPILVGAAIAVIAVASIGIAVASGGGSGSGATTGTDTDAGTEGGANGPSDEVTLSASYEGTFTNTSENDTTTRPGSLGITCTGDTCRLLGYGDSDLRLTRSGLTFTGGLPEQATTCDDPVSGAVIVKVVLSSDGRTMTMEYVLAESRKVPCEPGEGTTGGYVQSLRLDVDFTGTLVEGRPSVGL